ncbi:MAG TPA: hypothetical protein VM889_01445 [Candidatus Thermoplasmatota archaeon]|nr:hypothetical protein [Candidatus Thermoplasmatota archaeon]
MRLPHESWRILAVLGVLLIAAAPSSVALAPAAPDLDLPGPLRDRVGLSGAAPATNPAGEASTGQAPYGLRFRCPSLEDTPAGVQGCPLYVLDVEDIISQPILLIDPKDANLIGFNALHGGRGLHPLNEPPTERSRHHIVHQPHTTFRTTDGGALWFDNPYHPPDAMVKDRRDIFGEDNAAVLDGTGRLYIASAYSYRDSAGFGATSDPKYAVALWKAHRLNREIDYYANTKIIPSGNEGANKIDSAHAIFVPGTNVVAALWREEAAGKALDVGLEGKKSYVQVVYTEPETGAMWEAIPESERIGPCRTITNPLAYGHLVYLGCLPDEGYEYASNATTPTFQIHAIDTTTWTTKHVSPTPMDTAEAILAKRGDAGLMILVGSELGPKNNPVVKITYGESGARWSSPDEVGDKIASKNLERVIGVRVTAVAFAPVSGNIHMIYMERHDPGQAEQSQAAQPSYVKIFASFRAEGSFQGSSDLGVGQVRRVEFSTTLTGVGTGVFDDLHDSIVVWRDPNTQQDREFVAFGDFGYVRFGEVIEENFIPPPIIAGAPVPPVPLATAGANYAALGAGLLSGAAVLRLLSSRKKTTTEAPTL